MIDPVPTRRAFDRRGRMRFLLEGRRVRVGLLALTSLVGGLLEALFLVVVTRSAFALTDGEDALDLVGIADVDVKMAAFFALVLVLARAALAGAGAWQSARLTGEVIADLRKQLGGAFLGANWPAQHGERAGRLQELLTTFTDRGVTLILSVTQAVTSASNLFALLIVSVVVSPAASVLVVLAVASLASLLRPLRTAVRRQGAATATTGMDFATSLSEVSQLGLEMHVFAVQPQTQRRVFKLVDTDALAIRRLVFLKGMVPTVYTGLAYVALVGALVVLANFDFADIASVGTVVLLMLRSLTYGQALQTSLATVSSSMPFLDVLQEELRKYRQSELIDHGIAIGKVGELTVDRVSFGYSPGVLVLRDVSLTVQPREVVGVVGPSGSGKSSLIQLLLALREPTDGCILASGRDIHKLSKQEWARRVTFVPQGAQLIAGSIADNIRFLRDGVSEADVVKAARMANLHDDVMAFAEGYERWVGEQGSHLSGGQQQRMIIARALVENPDVLILDEPTSSLDVRSEHLIRQTLDLLRDRMTIIIIAHRLATLEICDRIMVIQDGELKGFDTPKNLEKSSEFYREALVLSGLR